MKSVDMWRWRYHDPIRNRSVVTRYVMTADQARKQLGSDATPEPGSLEVRRVAETAEEALRATSAGHLYRGWNEP